MSQLYVVGYTAHVTPGTSFVDTPTLYTDGPEIKILWASWCDVIFVTPTHAGAQLQYQGSSLNEEQVSHVESLKYLPNVRFFGTDLSHGITGYIVPQTHEITLFAMAKAIQGNERAIKTYSIAKSKWTILDLRFTSANRLLIHVQERADRKLTDGRVLDLPSLEALEEWLGSQSIELDNKIQMALDHYERVNFSPSQWCTNAATLTALDQDGDIYTWAFDRRFPKCLGRPSEEGCRPHLSDHAARIPYFSETKIKKIASGGYYSAAITDDGELYVWGRANATSTGATSELSVLQDKADDDEDEFVRSVKLEVNGRPARAIDVSVGWGHMLVVADVKVDSREWTSTVFAAGRNDRGQLASPGSVGSAARFVELPAFRGWVVEQVVCTGFTSYVVVRKRRGMELGRAATGEGV